VPKTYKVKITETAQADLSAIWDYIAVSSPQNAMRFVEELEEKALSLGHFPQRHPVIPESELLRTRAYRHMIIKDYRIIYRFNLDTVYILRIFHGAKLLDVAEQD
jgi:toxin ParE1/3/4